MNNISTITLLYFYSKFNFMPVTTFSIFSVVQFLHWQHNCLVKAVRERRRFLQLESLGSWDSKDTPCSARRETVA